MNLTSIDFLNGLFSIVFVITQTVVGLKIASRYFEIRKKIYLYVGLGWAGIVSAWYPSSISFLLILFTGKGLNIVLYFFIGNVILHLSTTLFLYGICELILPKKRNLFIIIYIIIGVIYNIYFYYFLFTDPSIIGTIEGNFDVTYMNFVRFYLLFDIISVVLIFILYLGWNSFKSKKKYIIWKGRFLLIASAFFLVGAICDATFTLTPITLIIIRMILIIGSLSFYIGFLMPERLKLIIEKRNKNKTIYI